MNPVLFAVFFAALSAVCAPSAGAVEYVAHQGEEGIAPNHSAAAYRLAVEHVGERDTIWQRDFPEPVSDFHAALSGVTDFGRGLDSASRIAGHALNVFYADGTATKVFAPQENVFTQR